MAKQGIGAICDLYGPRTTVVNDDGSRAGKYFISGAIVENYVVGIYSDITVCLDVFNGYVAKLDNGAIVTAGCPGLRKERLGNVYSTVAELSLNGVTDKYVIIGVQCIAVQVNGKMRGTVLMEADLDNDTVVANVLADEKIARFLEKNGGNIIKTIVVKNKLVNLIVK